MDFDIRALCCDLPCAVILGANAPQSIFAA
jgi:hypothetical protein